MSIGPIIRALFGTHERWVADAYRGLYVNIDELAAQIHQWVPVASRILEVGCGEGAMTERLAAAYPEAEITAIDITPRLGRLYDGPRDRVRFLQCTVQEIADREPGYFHLAVLCDVLHHVPLPARQHLLSSIRRTLTSDGVFVFKDWERNNTLIHWLCHASDRWLTGDRVSYMTRGEIQEHLTRSFGDAALVAKIRIGPWRNNLAILVRP
jgi:2-polyprenyl-6-hydroxyphenyl methylase/3-demethylubiquinone-9 3-methyltransferase